MTCLFCPVTRPKITVISYDFIIFNHISSYFPTHCEINMYLFMLDFHGFPMPDLGVAEASMPGRLQASSDAQVQLFFLGYTKATRPKGLTLSLFSLENFNRCCVLDVSCFGSNGKHHRFHSCCFHVSATEKYEERRKVL